MLETYGEVYFLLELEIDGRNLESSEAEIEGSSGERSEMKWLEEEGSVYSSEEGEISDEEDEEEEESNEDPLIRDSSPEVDLNKADEREGKVEEGEVRGDSKKDKGNGLNELSLFNSPINLSPSNKKDASYQAEEKKESKNEMERSVKSPVGNNNSVDSIKYEKNKYNKEESKSEKKGETKEERKEVETLSQLLSGTTDKLKALLSRESTVIQKLMVIEGEQEEQEDNLEEEKDLERFLEKIAL
ncbi:hypothetical protein L2E82_06850 [Cichorium intybus]|uniref:Uncharacterized protein n=1 Tax=Cichorium intybus TaxID=13427 RepID=A0ACB9G3G6_CICIN|nr:hypothetical protein L2E82_06850 [Cichorium intybus]